jgi:hypothetical protein
MSSNGQQPSKPPMDVNLLTPNDYRRLRAALPDRDLDDLLASGQPEDIVQTLILGFKLREDPTLTWEQAGDIPAGEVFDMAAGREPDPQTGQPGSLGPAAAPKPARRSRSKPAAPASAPN